MTGTDKKESYLFPVYSHRERSNAGRSSGHILNWLWASNPEHSWATLFPVYWRSESGSGSKALYGPLYVSDEPERNNRKRTLLFPWIYSAERDDTGYDYRGVLFRLFALEKQVFEGEERRRLWLFFVFRVPLP